MKFVIIGGTGTLGRELIRQLFDAGHGDVICVSRDELKQKELSREFPFVKCVIGDIRDKDSLRYPCRDADVIFHVAALKHIDVVEENPIEGFKTNVQGTINVAQIAIEYGVPHVVFSSTDKAVLPINTYGLTKALSEKMLYSLNLGDHPTKFSVFKWGNVMGSRGSVVHIFSKSLDAGHICLTDTEMTRFWIHIEDAVKFMIDNYQTADVDRAMIPPMKASTVMRLADAVARHKGTKEYDIEVVGVRAGEKLHEQLESNHEFCLRSDTCEQYTDSELDALVGSVL